MDEPLDFVVWSRAEVRQSASIHNGLSRPLTEAEQIELIRFGTVGGVRHPDVWAEWGGNEEVQIDVDAFEIARWGEDEDRVIWKETTDAE